MGGNIFKKISRGANNFFKKVDNGASNFFKKLPSNVESIAGKVKNGLNQGLDAVGDVARKVGNSLEKAAPMIAMGASMIAPQFAPAIMGGMTAATSMAKNIQQGARAGQGTVNQLAQQVNNKSQQLSGQAQKAISNGMSNLQSQANNAMMRGENAYNDAKRQTMSIH